MNVFLTVPHSGTRWTREAHDLAGVSHASWHCHEQGIKEFKSMKLKDNAGECEFFLQLRHPLATWGTWMYRQSKRGYPQLRSEHEIFYSSMPDYFSNMIQCIHNFPWAHIVRVEDGLLPYGKDVHSVSSKASRFPVESDIKDAVAARDLPRIMELDRNNLLGVFNELVVPVIRPIYENYYDFWWVK